MKTPVFLSSVFVAVILLFAYCTEDRVFNTLTVQNGSGSGVYEAGDRIQIEADTPPAGTGFFAWTGDTDNIDDAQDPLTSVTMPLHDVTLTATYKDLPTYQLTVENGTGSGRYLADTKVTIAATPPDSGNWEFVIWEGDLNYIKDEEDEVTQITMPAMDISVRAVFQESDLVSFQNDIFPIFVKHCNYAGCHDGNSNYYPYTTHAEIAARALEIEDSMLSSYMPPNSGMTQAEKDLFYLWVDQGKKNN